MAAISAEGCTNNNEIFGDTQNTNVTIRRHFFAPLKIVTSKRGEGGRCLSMLRTFTAKCGNYDIISSS